MNKPSLDESCKALSKALETSEAAEHDMSGNFIDQKNQSTS